MVDFTEQQIHLLSFNPDEILSGGSVNSPDILPLSCVEDYYNLMLKGTPVILTRESYKLRKLRHNPYTNQDLDPQDVYSMYDRRWEIETFF